MGVREWLWSINELIKAFLVVWGILGYTINSRRFKILPVFFGVDFGLSYLFAEQKELFALLGVLSFLLLFLSDTVMNKIRGFLVAEMILATVDLFMANVFSVIFQTNAIYKNPFSYDFVFDIFWILVVALLFRYRKKVNEYISHLSFVWFLIMVLILFGLGLLAGIMHQIIKESLNVVLFSKTFFVYTLIMLLLYVTGGFFVFYVVSKRNLSLYIEQQKEKYFLEKKYYEDKIKQNEEIQRFRHDMKKHMKVIQQLCDEITENNCSTERLQEYISSYLDIFPKNDKIYTGNVISDCFINELIEEMSNNDKFVCDIVGKLPAELHVLDTDFSILLGNILDNAKEELLKIHGECYLRIIIKNYKSNVMITVENSKAVRVDGEEKGQGHGYGIKNMKEVVDRYDGSIDFIETEDSFCVDVFI